MTAILFDGFDHGDTGDRWTANGAGQFATDVVRTGTRSLKINVLGQLYLALNSVQEDDTIYVGFGFNHYTLGGTNHFPLALTEGFGAINHIALRMDMTVRGWSIRRGATIAGPSWGLTTGDELVATQPNMWFPQSWHYIELGARIHDSAGWVELRQDGVTRLRYDGDTRAGGTDGVIDQVTFNIPPGGAVYALDDVYILNEQGAINNSWLGDTRCYPLYPMGNGFYAQWLGSDGNGTDNYLLVDEVGTPVTADYIAETVVGEKDSFIYENLPVNLGTVRGVEVRTHASKSDTGTKQFRMFTRRLSTDAFHDDKTLAAIPLYQTHTTLLELDPHAGPDIWTIDNVNASEWGVEVRS